MSQSVRLLAVLVASATAVAAQTPAEAVIKARAEYRARAARLGTNDIVRHFALAEWCARRNLRRCQQWQLHVVLRANPDHVGARAMLGHVKHAGKWMPRDDAMRAQGRVLFEGHWLRKYDIAQLQHRRKLAQHGLSVQHRANLLLVRLADVRPTERAAALAQLEVLAKAERSPELAALGRKVAADYAAFWKKHRRHPAVRAGTALVTVNAQHSKLLGMDTFTTSLGNGAPVRIQLPRMKTISIGTTVPIPVR